MSVPVDFVTGPAWEGRDEQPRDEPNGPSSEQSSSLGSLPQAGTQGALPESELLIVDDEANHVLALRQTLELEGYRVDGVTSPRAALTLLARRRFDVVISDLKMPEMDGIRFLRAALRIDPSMAVIVMTGHGTIDTAVRAMQAGAHDFIVKPLTLGSIRPVLARALAVRRLRAENIQLQEALDIYKLSMSVAFVLDFETALQNIANAAIGHSLVRGVSIWIPTEAGDELRVAATGGDDVAYPKDTRIPFDPDTADRIERGRARYSDAEQPDSAQADEEAALVGTLRGVSIPMLPGGRFAGLLNVMVEHPDRPIVPGTRRALQILANAVASAIERAALLSQLRSAEQDLRRSLAQKEAMLNEIHHGVKNNLQVVCSLLSLQAEQVEDPEVRCVFLESQNLIHAMALIHQQLYTASDFAEIDFGSYLRALTSHLLASYGSSSVRVRIDAAGAHLGLAEAVPCGLIVNELVSNLLKHSFHSGAAGEIRIACWKANGRSVLTVDDDCQPIPDEISADRAATTEMRVVKALIGQLGGELTVGKAPKFSISYLSVNANERTLATRESESASV